jgi:hypothetical protein
VKGFSSGAHRIASSSVSASPTFPHLRPVFATPLLAPNPQRKRVLIIGDFMFDLPYILTHPPLAAIVWRCAELSEKAEQLAASSGS